MSNLKCFTSNDANVKVEINDGVPKRGGYHGHPTHQSTDYDNWSASKTIDQHAAHRSCKKKKKMRMRMTKKEQYILVLCYFGNPSTRVLL